MNIESDVLLARDGDEAAFTGRALGAAIGGAVLMAMAIAMERRLASLAVRI